MDENSLAVLGDAKESKSGGRKKQKKNVQDGSTWLETTREWIKLDVIPMDQNGVVSTQRSHVRKFLQVANLSSGICKLGSLSQVCFTWWQMYRGDPQNREGLVLVQTHIIQGPNNFEFTPYATS